MVSSARVRAQGSVAAGIEAVEKLDHRASVLARSTAVRRLEIGRLLETFASKGGHHELFFRSVSDYVVERCQLTPGWAKESRSVARRLAELPRVEHALVEHRIGWAAAELLCRHATPETEAALVEAAASCTVRQLREHFRRGPVFEALDQCEPGSEDSVRLRLTLSRADAELFEATLRAASVVAGTSSRAALVDALLAEGTSSLCADVPHAAEVLVAEQDRRARGGAERNPRPPAAQRGSDARPRRDRSQAAPGRPRAQRGRRRCPNVRPLEARQVGRRAAGRIRRP